MQGFKAFVARHGAGGYAKHLKIVKYVGFDTGKPRLCRVQIVGFNGKGDVFRFHKAVVALCKLIFQHIRVLGANGVESVVLRRNCDCFFRVAAPRSSVDERELHRNGSVKVIEEVAPIFKNGGLVVCLCKLIIYVVVGNAFAVFLIRNLADTVRVHLQVGYGLLRGVRFSVALCLLDKGGDFLFLGAGELAPISGGFCLCL